MGIFSAPERGSQSQRAQKRKERTLLAYIASGRFDRTEKNTVLIFKKLSESNNFIRLKRMVFS
jgi:hypothetical protein